VTDEIVEPHQLSTDMFPTRLIISLLIRQRYSSDRYVLAGVWYPGLCVLLPFCSQLECNVLSSYLPHQQIRCTFLNPNEGQILVALDSS